MLPIRDPPQAKGRTQIESERMEKDISCKLKSQENRSHNIHQTKQTLKQRPGFPFMAQWLTNPTKNNEYVGSIPGLTQWIKDLALP